jgi:hypothetical protein
MSDCEKMKILKTPRSGEIVKSVLDEEEGIVFGWASIVSKAGNLIEDDDGDVIFPEDLEKAAYDYVFSSRQQSDTHMLIGVGSLIESKVYTKSKQEAMGIDLGFEGWWVGFRVDKATYPDVWNKIKKGEYPMFSIGGFAEKEEYNG